MIYLLNSVTYTQKKEDVMGIQQEHDFEQRRIGVVVPVGALRGKKSGGVGEFPDLAEFALLAVKMGVTLIQLLPVNDTGYESSPYSALSAFALHPLYLRIGDLPEAAPFASKIETRLRKPFEQESRFLYQKIIWAKMALLREIYAANEKKIAKDAGLATWIEQNPWVMSYAVFRRFKQLNSERSWKEWVDHRQLTRTEITAFWDDEELKGEHLFWAWVQRALDTQFSAAAKAVANAGILLEGDLPILINDDSCDVWAYPEYFHLDLSAGAPPDMYSPNGQNWGFPVYNWQNLKKDNFVWWKDRLKAAEKYYKAYRIDHVLGFFRIWASSQKNLSSSSILGRYVPARPLTLKDLKGLGFDNGRIRWLSYPHIPTSEVWESLAGIKKENGDPDYDAIAAEAEKAFMQALDRINNEELWAFKPSIEGERAIAALGLYPSVSEYLIKAWSNRTLLEYQKGSYLPVWYFRKTRAYLSLSEKERADLEALLEQRQLLSEQDWGKQGKELLSVLAESSGMLPCAEDLGEVPDCVPKVLTKLRILGLRVVRWARDWKKDGEPYFPFEEYPELSVCTPGVHDASTLREWWDREADQEGFAAFLGLPSLPKVYNPGTAKVILQKTAAAASRFRVFQIQDLLHLSSRYYAPDPASERINVPGTVGEFNWTYRLPVSIEELAKDGELIHSVKELALVQPAVAWSRPR
jgi:4-alpha-glucanotransferase